MNNIRYLIDLIYIIIALGKTHYTEQILDLITLLKLCLFGHFIGSGNIYTTSSENATSMLTIH